MNSAVKAAATVQNNILLVQYSPTGAGVGDLYAILLTDMTKPLPFQIQRQTPGLQGSTNSIAAMSLTTLQFKAPPPPKSLAEDPDSGGLSPADTAPPLLAQSPIDPNANKSTAVTPAPPFSDIVLAVNLADFDTHVWHLKAPDRSVPPGSPASSPPTTGGGPGAGAGTGPTTLSKLPAPLWTESALPQTFFPDAMTISVGGQRAQSSKSASILALMMSRSGFYRLMRLVYRRSDSGSAISPASSTAQAPPPSTSLTPLTAGEVSNNNNAAAVQSAAWSLNMSSMIESWASDHRIPGYTLHLTPVPASAEGGGFSDGIVGSAHPDFDSWTTLFINDNYMFPNQANR
ncbi:hypothetical protein DFQ26_004628 [Actinomortierella ambigua]|nr:hypothetical protein DFQ26_004628 [Actinomortierella ambigua]